MTDGTKQRDQQEFTSIPMVVDRVDGSKESFGIRRFRNEQNGVYTAEYWNIGGWAAFCYVFKDKKLAESIRDLLAAQSQVLTDPSKRYWITEQGAKGMEVINYATGVNGSYCIRRMNGVYASYWNPGGWAAFGYVFSDKLIADSLCAALVSLEERQKEDALRLLFYNAMNIGAMQGFPTVDQCGAWLDSICERAERHGGTR